MRYQTETGIILKGNLDRAEIMQVVDGNPGSVDFPAEALLQFHKDNPGIVYCLAHTHPPQMYNLSKRDQLTLKAWAITFSPYPARISTIAHVEGDVFRVSIYLGILETKEAWIARGKEGNRKFEIIPETSYDISSFSQDLLPWERIIINKSYHID